MKILPKASDKYSINIKYYEHMILDDYVHLESVSKNPIPTILKAIRFSKAVTNYMDVF